jgi:DNA repair protein RecN (Recombination protein N)
MIKHLYIRHFTIIDEVEVELSNGLTVLTGETGAGKSILIDALQVVLGERAESGFIKTGEARCEVTAIFDVANNAPAQQWLAAQEMDEGQECMIRRVLTTDGRSRATINARPCALQSVRELGALLVHIHGQNQHQQLLKSDYQRELLDDYTQNLSVINAVQKTYQAWREATNTLATASTQDTSKQKDFLAFQLRELEALALQANELEALAAEHRRLSHAEQWIINAQQALNLLAENDNSSVLHGLYTADTLVKNLSESGKTASELLQQATIQTEEAATHIRQLLKTLEPDPERMQWIDQRLAHIHDVARKHRVSPEELLTLQQTLESQYEALDQSAERIALLEEKITQLVKEYAAQAKQLTQSRQKAAKKLSAAVSTHIQTLGMPGGCVEIMLASREDHVPHLHGAERIEFLVTTNPGQSPQALSKVVSGGELSRIALAIQVVAAEAAILPTLIFDEVDVGIGGGTAEIVGKQLKNLGNRAQVLCVTHLPQVAAQGHQHLHVQKQTQNEKVTTGIRLLSSEEKIQEIARMLGGVKITEKTLAHAKEMVG